MRMSKLRPSPAVLIACVALFVALGGVGYAAVTVSSAQIKNNSIKSVDLKNRGIATKDISAKAIAALEGQKGDTGATGATGAAGPTGAPGAPGADGAPGAPGADGADGTALAYAYVNADGSITESRSKGVTDANVVANNGVYGFRGLGFTPRSVVTTMSFDSQAVTGNNASGGATFVGDCTAVAGTDQACATTDTDGDAGAEPRAFFVLFN